MAAKPPDILGNPSHLLDVVLGFNSKADYTSLLSIILSKMMDITFSDAGTLYLIEEDKLHFHIVKNNTIGISQITREKAEIDIPPIKLDNTNINNVSAYCAIHNKTVVVEDVYTDDRFDFYGPKEYDRMTGYRTRSMLVVPLTAGVKEDEEILGVIQLLNATHPGTGMPISFNDNYDLDIVNALAKIAANTLANLIHVKDINLLFHSFVKVMTQAIDERSHSTRYHTQNVSHYCTVFTEYLSTQFPVGHKFHFDENHRDRLSMAALLHDVGKIGTPTRILDKSSRLSSGQMDAIKYRFEIKRYQLKVDKLTGTLSEEDYKGTLSDLEKSLKMIELLNLAKQLTDGEYKVIQKLTKLRYIDSSGNESPMLAEADVEALSIARGNLTSPEWDIMREHVSATGRILDQITFWKYYKDVSSWSKDHHEFLDGTGYPKGLKGDEIATETCIITMMDIFDALTTTDRPYRVSMPPAKAVGVLQKMADEGKLHSELVEVFIKSGLWEGMTVR